jgi:molybdenum cofactor cytidylyltransferase
MPPVGILLAAGRGRRFDPTGARNKLLQPLQGGDTLVLASARHLLAVLPEVVAVVAPGDGGVAQLLRDVGCRVVVCEDADTGMAASLRCALDAASSASGWVIALGDMPHVQPATIAAIAQALADGATIAAPMLQGRRGNPVGFSRALLPQLLALEGDHGARGILQTQEVTAVAVDDAGIFSDVDSPADL